VLRSLERVASEMGIFQARVLAGALAEVVQQRKRDGNGSGVRIVEMYLPD
jgi:hypothetical protein